MRVRPHRSTRHSKTHHLIAAFVPALIITFSITGFVWASTDVTVVEDGKTRHIDSHADDVAGTLAEAGILLDDSDMVTPPRDSEVRAGQVIVVRHAVPVVLSLGGEDIPFEVVGETVADALVSAGIDPAANPAVVPSLGSALKPGMTIKVPDVFVRVLQEETTVAAGVRNRPDASLAHGARRTVRAGRPGRILRVYRVVVVGGVETNRILSATKVVTKPSPAVVAVGTARRAARVAPARLTKASTVSRARIGAAPKRGRKMRVTATGYSAAQPGLGDTTATGARARRGVVAVDPSVIPLGTRLYVPGYGYAIAADTGSAVRGNTIDLCFDTVAEARQWGRRSIVIVIVD